MEPLREQDPRQAGAYRLTARLGTGGMGEVFLGETPGRERVAVKFLKNEHAHDPQFRRRFAREVASARMVSGAHTAPVVDADPDGDPPWLATAYIPGPSLADAVGRDGPMPGESVRRLGADLAEGLSAIHARGLIHRDLKPANIILAGDGPRIIDFGVARTLAETSLTATGMVIGTIGYMSPEQVGGARVDARSDVFALGGILAYAATGRGPFDAPSMAAVAARIVGGPPDLDGLDGPLRETIEACLAKDLASRPSPDGLAAALQSGQSPTLLFAPGTEPGFPPRRRLPGARPVIAGLIVVAAVVVALVLLSGGPASNSPAGPSAPAATESPPASVTAPAGTHPSEGPPGKDRKHKKPKDKPGHGPHGG